SAPAHHWPGALRWHAITVQITHEGVTLGEYLPSECQVRAWRAHAVSAVDTGSYPVVYAPSFLVPGWPSPRPPGFAPDAPAKPLSRGLNSATPLAVYKKNHALHRR